MGEKYVCHQLISQIDACTPILEKQDATKEEVNAYEAELRNHEHYQLFGRYFELCVKLCCHARVMKK
jgi:hypothetical protein